MMKIITAPESIEIKGVSVFLAGGITNCPNWQGYVIERLKKKIDPSIECTVLNPRRLCWDMAKDKAEDQIKWEYKSINRSDIFSIWFSDGESVQPIALYELGRYVSIFGDKKTVIGVSPYYKRALDVYIQMSLINKCYGKKISSNLEQHVINIVSAIEKNGKHET